MRLLLPPGGGLAEAICRCLQGRDSRASLLLLLLLFRIDNRGWEGSSSLSLMDSHALSSYSLVVIFGEGEAVSERR